MSDLDDSLPAGEASTTTAIVALALLGLTFCVCMLGACTHAHLIAPSPDLPPDVQLARLHAAIVYIVATSVVGLAVVYGLCRRAT
jgi:hypothetical protein